MKNTILALPAPKRILIPPPNYSAEVVRKICGVERKREFCLRPTDGKCRVVENKTWPYKGSFKTYPKIENLAYITSYAVLSEGMVTIRQSGKSDVVRFSPKGMKFAADGNGVKIVRTSDGMDYHPSLNDWRDPRFATVVREGMAENFKRRAAQRKAEKQAARTAKEKARLEQMIKRDLRNTRVTLDDSRKAGNCVEGTLAFCERKLGLSREEILSGGYMLTISADRLVARANGDSERVNAAIYRAWMRETTVCI